MTRLWMACVAAVLGLGLSAPAAAQPTAAEIVARSVKAHGGDALTSWQTLKITGTVVMQDGIAYTGAYTLLAKAPDRLRVEHDATADRGRAFYDYFLNGGVAWSRRNLIPGTLEVDRIQRWMDQCYGIAFYARPGVTLELMPEGTIDWPPPATPAGPGSPRKVWVIAATVGTERRDLPSTRNRLACSWKRRRKAAATTGTSRRSTACSCRRASWRSRRRGRAKRARRLRGPT